MTFLNFVRRTAVFAILILLLGSTAVAAPLLTVTPNGLDSGGHRLWLVDVAPDPALFSDTVEGFGGSMAVELAFAIDHTDLLGVDVNTTAWVSENPGNNPFTGTVTDGLWLDLIGHRTFGAFGSVIFTSDDPVRLFTIKTEGSGLTTIRYGSEASGDPILGARIAQGGMNFDGYSGSVTIPEPATLTWIVVGAMTWPTIGHRRVRRKL